MSGKSGFVSENFFAPFGASLIKNMSKAAMMDVAEESLDTMEIDIGL